MKIALIFAMDEHRGIGKDNDLPWKLPREMKFFKETTTDNIVVMGRKTWESIPEKFRPLPNRKNIVITRNSAYKAEGAIVVNDLDNIQNHFNKQVFEMCFLIGGSELFKLALQKEIVDEMYVTHIHEVFEADTFFPFVNWENWKVETLLEYEKDKKNPHSFTIKKYSK